MTSIAIMNAKGGVGKSTLTMALAETLSVYHGKSVLLIDADGQMSLSLMMISVERLNDLRSSAKTMGGYLASLLPNSSPTDWRTRIASDIGDVDDATALYLLAGDMDITLLEREIIEKRSIPSLRKGFQTLLHEAAQHVDFVLVDCAPGISVVTECWLRECAWHLLPLRPDVLAVAGMQYLNAFKRRDLDLGFAKHLGVVINMKQSQSDADELMHEMLRSNSDLRCFRSAIPMVPHLQKAALYVHDQRSYQNKYPGEVGHALRSIAGEVVTRVHDVKL